MKTTRSQNNVAQLRTIAKIQIVNKNNNNKHKVQQQKKGLIISKKDWDISTLWSYTMWLCIKKYIEKSVEVQWFQASVNQTTRYPLTSLERKANTEECRKPGPSKINGWSRSLTDLCFYPLQILLWKLIKVLRTKTAMPVNA